VPASASANLGTTPETWYDGPVAAFEFGGLQFSWSERKAKLNLENHGVSFEEAATVFLDPLARLYDDPDHSASESRFLLVGHSLAGQLLLVVHAEKRDTIRVISARRATSRERRRYAADA
jgi:uncharacterized DUF497 family protein